MTDIKRIIQGRTPEEIGDKERFRCAVCIAMLEKPEGHEVIFEVRASTIPSQPGDVCLPGGAIEEGETSREAAVRETCEELLIQPEQIEIIGEADTFRTGNLLIHPYVAVIKDYQGTYSTDEVESVFTVPLQFFLETKPEEYIVPYEPQFGEDFPFDRIVGGKDYKWRQVEQKTLFYQYEYHTIWGFTALLMNSFGKILRREV
ncbi:MAG: CoA pyrophosphatase [Eubacterium sp.]|nr:CoA pyrophosphatase [Eubacterium sp.]